MDANDAFTRMFQVLKLHGVYASAQFRKDIEDLVKTDIIKFIDDFTKAFSRINLKEQNKYERLSIRPEQKKKLDGNSLFRYEYRNTSNLRCIYITRDVNNSNKTILLNAFNEVKGKTKGKNSYRFNIERAIKTYENLK